MNQMIWMICAVSLWVLSSGCSQRASQGIVEEEKNPFYTKGMQKLQERDFEGAKEAFEKILDLQPNHSRAHFELAVLLDGDHLKANDYIGAVYHYRKFLDLKPQSEKAEIVRGRMASDVAAIGATVPHSDLVSPQEIARLQSENASLRHENDQYRFRLEQLTHGGSVHPEKEMVVAGSKSSDLAISGSTAPVATLPGVAAAPTAPTKKAQTYTVQKGDTLSSIAKKLLGASAAAEKIYAMNRAVLPDKNKLTVGQVLAIPPR